MCDCYSVTPKVNLYWVPLCADWGALIRSKCYPWVRKEFVKLQKWMLYISLQVSFHVPPTVPGTSLFFIVPASKMLAPQGEGASRLDFSWGHSISSAHRGALLCPVSVQILCVRSGLGLGMCPRFLHSWCASELNTFYHEIQVIGWLQHRADSCVFKCDLIPSQSRNLHFEYGISVNTALSLRNC